MGLLTLARRVPWAATLLVKTSWVQSSELLYMQWPIIINIKAYCMGGSRCRTLLLYSAKLTKIRALFISPRMWLGQWYIMSIAWPLLRHELCHTSYVQSNVTVCKNTFRWMSSMFLAVLTSDLISSFVRGLTVRLATTRAGLHAPACHTYSSYNSDSS